MFKKDSEKDYLKCLESKHYYWENLCLRCGGCCGAYDDPCQHLQLKGNKEYCCDIYDKRFGTQVTVTGEEFDCVYVKQIFHTHWKNDHLCIYKKLQKQGWVVKDTKVANAK